MALSDEERKARHREANRRWRAKAGVREREREQVSAWKKANPEKVRQYAREHYWRDVDTHREAMRLNMRGRRLANPERYNAERRAYGQANAERLNARRRERWANEPEYRARRIAQIRAYIAANPDQVMLSRAQGRAVRRARMRAALVEKVDYAEIIKRDRGRCHLCGKRVAKREIQLDHIVPLAVGGEHSAANLAVAHARCNLSKGAKPANDQLRLVG